MNKQTHNSHGLGKRTLACLLALVLFVGLIPVPHLRASAVSVDEAMQKVVDWGFMRGDISGNMRPNAPITRAEFVTIINRAFGYKVMNNAPFTDVKNSDWFAQDVAISYTEKYINGTSATTFSPHGKLTREQATVILARNLRLQPYPGEDTSFSDSRELQEWSRGLVEQAARYHIISGYPDGTFRPKKAITRGEAAILIVNAIGNPVQEEGVHSLPGTYGNVTITSSNVTLRDTVVAGNLYITDGVDLGSVLLENVRVLGQIILCGGGLSQDGDDSIVLRNVDAQELIVDTPRGQEVSLRVEGDGVINQATIRTNAYLKDNCGDNMGVRKIVLDGGKDAKLSLAGNVKEVVNITPGSKLNLVSGTAASITIDEAATESTLNLEAGTFGKEVNLDVGTTVTGKGDIGKLTVNAPGSTVTMLPDEIIVRPGDTVEIGGETMDSNAAAEASADPRLMGGYPVVTDLAPTSALAKFSANKKGTVYWAITPVTAGSIGAGDLINPPPYGTEIIKHGTVSLTGSSKENTAKLSSLKPGGGYYLSTVLVDSRQDQSPVKVVSFSTPDDTVPDFAAGYPYLSKVTNISAQVTVMPTKTCQLYYALLPKGATAPKGEDFKAGSGAIPGNLGYGSIPVTKNTTYPFDVNNVPLEELESYDLYLWLSDLEGGKSSQVKKLPFTTVDRTPPKFNVEATVNKLQPTSVDLYANLNENGTLFWAIVPEGEPYPKPLAGTDPNGTVDLSSDNAKLQVVSGMNALKNGKVAMTENKDVTFTVSGLEKEKSYDLYYVAQDKAGNYSDIVKKITIHTLDQSGPTVTQEFTRYNSNDPTHPLPDTDIRLVFSESVMDKETLNKYTDLYQKVLDSDPSEEEARRGMAEILRKNIILYEMVNGIEKQVVDRSNDESNPDWTVDYRFAKVAIEDGKMVVTLPTSKDPLTSALNLKSGATYYFKIDGIADTSSGQNPMGVTRLDEFTTVFAQVNLSSAGNSTIEIDPTGKKIPVDGYWRMNPVSTQNVADSVKWDMILWSDTTVEFTLWTRASKGANEWSDWSQVKADTSPDLGPSTQITHVPANGQFSGVSMTMNQNLLQKEKFNPLKELEEGTVYEYAVSFTKIRGDSERQNWSGTVNMNINVVAGENSGLKQLATDVSEANWKEVVGNGKAITNIGQPETLGLRIPFQDKVAPMFVNKYPTFKAGDSVVNMDLMLNRQGTVHYVVAPINTITTVGGKVSDNQKTTNYGETANWETLPESGNVPTPEDLIVATTPGYNDIVNAKTKYAASPDVKFGSVSVGQSVVLEKVTGLKPTTPYIAYFVTQGTASVFSPVYCYRFETGDVKTPVITLTESSPSVAFRSDETADLNYALFSAADLPPIFLESMLNHVDPDKKDEYQQEHSDPKYRIIDALQDSGREGFSSVFDMYAKEETKKTVREYIDRSSAAGKPVASGIINNLTSKAQSKDFSSAMNKESASNYYCLAVAKNVLGGEYTFKGVYPVFMPKTTPPKLKIESPRPTHNDKKDTYSGTITFFFDEILYYLPTNGETSDLKPVYNVDQDDQDEKYVSFKQHILGNVEQLTVGTPLPGESNTFVLNYKGARDGATITIFKDGFVSGVRGNSSRAPILLQFQAEKTGIGGGFNGGGKWVIISGQ